MLFTWSAECGPDDPVLVVPWSSDPLDPAAGMRFIDLRADPYAVEEIPEAEAQPALAHALRSLNAPRSPVFTAKCDTWPVCELTELHALALDLLEPEHPHLTGFAGYIDLVWRDRATFASFHQHQHVLHRLERRLAALSQPEAAVECVIRPALLDFDLPQEGFAVTLYVKAIASSQNPQDAQSTWARALGDVALTLRSRDLMPHTGTPAQASTTGG